MSAKKSTPSKGIQYLNQFLKCFLVPYGEPKELSDEDYGKRLKEDNCEMLVRPKMFLSEMSESILQNKSVLGNEWFDEETAKKIEKKASEFFESMKDMDTKNGSGQITEKDLKTFIKSLESDRLSRIFQEMFDMGHRLVLMGLYFQVARFFVENPEIFAAKVNLVSRNDVNFKKNPCKEEMLEMLKEECIKSQTPSTKKVKRALTSVFDSSSEEEEAEEQPPRKKSKKKVTKAKNKKGKKSALESEEEEVV